MGESVSAIIEDTASLIIPSIVVYEVFEKLLQETDEDRALVAIAHMKQRRVVSLDSEMAIYAAKIGKDFQLDLADSIIYANVIKFNGKLWTQDKHFKDLDHVQSFEKGKNSP